MDITKIVQTPLTNGEFGKREWNQRNGKNYYLFGDVIHVQMEVFEPINRIIDTPEFQRLRKLKQLGFSYLVYPSANHDRFSHSLGVYHLARKQVNALSKKHSDITTIDMLCVCIAGLAHDLGHGPLSHLYEEFLKKIDPSSKWRHEEQSILVFRHLLKNNKDVKLALDDYLTDQDYLFIEELIDPPKEFCDKDGNWLLEGRSKDKSYLYDIISNKHDSIDVDKFDYLLRDSRLTNVHISFGKNNLKRIRTYMEARYHKLSGYKRIAYDRKVISDLKNIMDSREDLHKIVYQHKTKIAFEIMILDAMVKAKQIIKYKGKDGKITLDEVHTDLEAFLELDDSVLDRIRLSSKPGLKKAQDILLQVERRETLRFVGPTFLTESKFLKLSQENLQEKIKNDISRNDETIDKEQVYVAVRFVHRGMGSEVDPLAEVLLFNGKDPTDNAVERVPDQRIRIDSKEKAKMAIVYVYVRRESCEYDKVYEAFKKCTEYYKSEVPPKRKKRNSRSIYEHFKDVCKTPPKRACR